MLAHEPDRRTFLRSLGRAAGLLVLVPEGLFALGSPTDPEPHGRAAVIRAAHPDPRPDVDGSAVLAADRVMPHLAELFDSIRRIPHIADGIACRCGCGAIEGMRSLLSCYEGVGMAQFCMICEGDGRLVVRLSDEGRTLDEIRAAIDGRR